MKNPRASLVDKLTKYLLPAGRSPVCASLLLLSLLGMSAVAHAASIPPLGTAANFGALGASTVTSTGATIVTGDLGVSPGTAVDGFPPGVVTGTTYVGAASNAGVAQADAVTAYNDAAGQTCNTDMTGVDLGGKTLTPGVYCFDTSGQLTGTLTLDFQNDSNAVFIFQTGSTITTGNNAAVVAINGSPSCNNVTWQIGSSATLGAGTQFLGNILALASVTLATGASNNGGLYALTGAVTLDTSLVQACGVPEPQQCQSDEECEDDGNICTDELCDPQDPGADDFGCAHEDNTAPCDDNLFCNGADTCSSGTCGHAGDPCIGGEVCGDSCNEVADNCFVLVGTQCRASAGICDVAETCTGESSQCPDDLFLTTECRASAGICDVAETCTGQAADCPADGFQPGGTACADDADVCTDDACNGAGACAHTNNSAPCDDGAYCTVNDTCSGGECNGSARDCDDEASCTVDACNEETNSCENSPSNQSCSDDGNVCTDQVCDPEAPGADAFGCTHPNNTASCDDNLFCNGDDTCSNGTCGHAGDPCIGGGACGNSCNETADNCFVLVGTQCRAAAGVCDVAESCTGESVNCPADVFLTTTCRASAGVCDVAETCTGSSASCPPNGFQPGGTACTDDADVCTDDACNGAGSCAHTNNSAPCNDGAYCTVNDTCSGGECNGSARNCGDDVSCTVDSCDEGANSCENSPSNQRCDDQDPCTIDMCDSQLGCDHEFSCRDICRSSEFYAKRAGDGQEDGNVTQSILDAVGGLEVCGRTITETSYDQEPYLEGLGLDSALEGLCVQVEGVKQRSLYRELVTTALNCAISGSASCDAVVSPFIDVSFSECDALCVGNVAGAVAGTPTSSLERECIRQLDCYNGGGRMVRGKCALGNCSLTGTPCGARYGSCPPIGVKLATYLQVCERFSGNCHDGEFCQPAFDICPSRLPVTSKPACKEAKHNTCTIDSCE